MLPAVHKVIFNLWLVIDIYNYSRCTKPETILALHVALTTSLVAMAIEIKILLYNTCFLKD